MVEWKKLFVLHTDSHGMTWMKLSVDLPGYHDPFRGVYDEIYDAVAAELFDAMAKRLYEEACEGLL